MPPRLAHAPRGARRRIEPEPVPVQLAPLRDLLSVDRRGAGEVRRANTRRELSTAAYSMPLHVQWRRAFRRHRRLRVMTWSAGLSIVAAVLLWQGPRLSAYAVGAVDWAAPRLSAQLDGIRSWAAPSLGRARHWMEPQLNATLDWAKRVTGLADPLWLRASASGELHASKKAPAP